MANLNDLFGGGGNKIKVANLKVVGEAVVGVIQEDGIDTKAPVFEWDNVNKRPGMQKFWVDGKPKGVAKDEAARAGLNPVYQIMVTVLQADGELIRIPFNSKDERESLKTAIEEAGGEINAGDTLGKRLIEREGNIKTHATKLVPAS